MSKNTLYKFNKVQIEIEDVQGQIKGMKKDLKYISTPEVRAVVTNMIGNKKLKIERLQNLKEELQEQLL